MNIILTGSTGFFGSAIKKDLTDKGHLVVGAARRVPAGGGPEDRIERLDVSSQESCEALMAKYRGFDAVVHAAALAHVSPGALPEEEYHKVNSIGTQNVLGAALNNGIKRFIFISSVLVYGESGIPVRVAEDGRVEPSGVYGAAKKKAEGFCLARSGEADIYVLRMATMYGGDWVYNLKKRVAPPVLGRFGYVLVDPLDRRYSFCSDINGAGAVRWAAEGRLKPGIYNVADDYEYCQMEVLRAVERVEGGRPHLRVPGLLPAAAARIMMHAAPLERWRRAACAQYWKFCRESLFSTARLRSAGFKAPPHLLELGVAKRAA